MYKRLDRLPGLKKIYADLNVDESSHPFVPERLEKALARTGSDMGIIEDFYIHGKTVQQTSGPRGVPNSTVETARKRALSLMRGMYELYI